jgi:hypothetical protein
MFETTPPPDQSAESKPHEYIEPEPDDLAKLWAKRVASARTHWEKYHKRVVHNRKKVAGFNWTKQPDSDDFYELRANLIHGTITAILPNIYARNPEMSVTAAHTGRDLKLFCKTLEKVTNRQLDDAKLKKRGKSSVRAALTCSIGIVKVMYQRDMKEDPVIKDRIQDTQDNIANVDRLLLELNDPTARADHEETKRQLEEAMKALQEKKEVVAAEGLVIDRVLTEHLLLDPTVAEFEDYDTSDWMVQIIPMKKSVAEGQFQMKLDKAKAYKEPAAGSTTSSGKIFSGEEGKGSDDYQIIVLEIWDKVSGRVLTMADGCDYFLRAPYSPTGVGERWYPFFLLPFQTVDGQVIGPSLVDLTEKLQAEHNDTREKKKKHRDAIKPGYVFDKGEMKPKDIEALQDAAMNEFTGIDANGKPIQNAVMPKVHTPLDPMLYDTSETRYDWEQVSGMQDAARSSVVQPKTATEASIMQQSLSGRVSEFRDQVEDFLQEIAQYTAQILLIEMTPQQVERIMGPHKTGPLTNADNTPTLDPMTGAPVIGVIEPSYDWPKLSREEVFDLVELKIRAGTTGEPDKLEQQEIWLKLMPVIQPLIVQIMQIQANGGDATPLIELLKETVARFDEKLDVEQFIPKKPVMPAMPAAGPGAAPAAAGPALQAVA